MLGCGLCTRGLSIVGRLCRTSSVISSVGTVEVARSTKLSLKKWVLLVQLPQLETSTTTETSPTEGETTI
jgi:hypothetical protein